jgi:hypothetical protein
VRDLAIYNVLADWSCLAAKGGAVMYRFGILGFLLSPLVIGAFPNAATAPVVAFSFYAPVQKDSPVHIVGLRYDYPTVEIDLETAVLSGFPCPEEAELSHFLGCRSRSGWKG